MDKIMGFFQGLMKKKGVDLASMGGVEGIISQLQNLSKDGKIDFSQLKKILMPLTSSFAPGSVKGFLDSKKGQDKVETDDAIAFLRENMQEDAPAAAAPKEAAPAAAPAAANEPVAAN